MDERFKKVEEQYFQLKGQLAAGRITREQLDEKLKIVKVEYLSRQPIANGE